MSKSTELADAIVTLLNTESFSMSFNAKRRSAPVTAEEIDSGNTVLVSVFTGAKKLERRTRNDFQRTYKPAVAVQRKLDGDDEGSELASVDQLEGLVEEIEAALEGEDLAGLSFVGFDEEQDREQYSVEAMQNLKYFATAIVLEYVD